MSSMRLNTTSLNGEEQDLEIEKTKKEMQELEKDMKMDTFEYRDKERFLWVLNGLKKGLSIKLL